MSAMADKRGLKYEYALGRVYGQDRDRQQSEIMSWAKEGWRLVAATEEWLYFERPLI